MFWITGGRTTSRDEIETDYLPAFLAYYERFDGLRLLGRGRAVDRRVPRLVPLPSRARAPRRRARARLPPAPVDLGQGLRHRRFDRARSIAASGTSASRRVLAETMAVNTASRRVMEKAGMRLRPHVPPGVAGQDPRRRARRRRVRDHPRRVGCRSAESPHQADDSRPDSVRTIGAVNTSSTSRGPRWVDVAVVLPLLGVVVLGTSQIDVEAGSRADRLARLRLRSRRRRLARVLAAVGDPVTAVVATTMFVYLARNYEGGPSHLAGPLSLLALGYTAPRRVAWFGRGGSRRGGGARWRDRRRVRAPTGDRVRLGLRGRVARAGDRGAQRAGRRRARAARPRAASRRSPTSGCASPRTSTTPSPTRWRRSTCSPASPPTSSSASRSRRPSRWRRSARPAATRSTSSARSSACCADPDERGRRCAPVAGIARHRRPRRTSAGRRPRRHALTTTGDVAGVAPSIGTAAYRVVQEALTNARRHAGPGATATVEVAVGRAQRAPCRRRRRRRQRAGRIRRPGTGAGFGLDRHAGTGRVDRRHARGRPAPGRGYRVVATWQPR